MPVFNFSCTLPVDAATAFAYHARAGAFSRLCPPWENLSIQDSHGTIRDGDWLSFRVSKGPIKVTWRAEHEGFVEGRQFCDRQVEGPFKSWVHRHSFSDSGDQQSRLTDQISFELPLGRLGAVLGEGLLRKQLVRLFQFRHRRTADDLSRLVLGKNRPKQVLMVGPLSGLVQDFANFLSVGGHGAYHLQSHQVGKNSRFVLKPFFGTGDGRVLDEIDAVILTRFRLGEPVNPELASQMKFVSRVIRQSRTPPSLLIHLHEQRPRLERFTSDPGLHHRRTGTPGGGDRENNEVLQYFLDGFEREIQLHLASQVHGSMGHLIQILLKLETYLFLEHGAKTPEFQWIAREDAVGVLFHLLFSKSVQGELFAGAPTTASRAQLQRILLRRSFLSYSGHRLLKVLPWSRTGMPAKMDRPYRHMKSLSEFGFRFLYQDLGIAVRDAFGDLE